MAAAASALEVLSALTLGVATFLYNDGHGHKHVANISFVLGGGGLILANIGPALGPPQDCDVSTDCPTSLLGFLWVVVGDSVLGGLLAVACAAIGLGVSKLTSREPTDGRGAILPFDPDDLDVPLAATGDVGRISAAALAREMEVDAKALTRWLRRTFPEEAPGRGGTWALLPRHITAAREWRAAREAQPAMGSPAAGSPRSRSSSSSLAAGPMSGSCDGDPLSG